MSDQPPPAKKPRLSKFGSAHARNKTSKTSKDQAKSHGFDATKYHQNANRRGIHALVKFDCPICQCKNTVLVDLDNKERTATVRCTYCLSLKPRPPELPYPFTTLFTPRLENKADAFFRFYEKYRALMQRPEESAALLAVQGARQRSGGTGDSDSAVDGGLLGNLDDLLAASPQEPTACTHPTVPQSSPPPREGRESSAGGSSEASEDKEAVGREAESDGGSEAAEGPLVHEAPVEGTDANGTDEGVDDVVDDVDAFFNDDS